MSKKILFTAVFIFAFIGFSFVFMYFAVKFHLTDTLGTIDRQNESFQKPVSSSITPDLYCSLKGIAAVSPIDAENMISIYTQGHSIELLNNMINAAKLEIQTPQCPETSGPFNLTDIVQPSKSPIFTWAQGEEWQTFKNAVIKDVPTLTRIEKGTGIKSRLLVSMLAVEQLRLYYSQREIFKAAFKPLNILGSQSQFSWGIMGMKQETAVAVEEKLSDIGMPHVLDFKTTDHDTERFNRIVDEHDHYYSYLYSALFLKEIEQQWQKAGFPISDRPEILATLFNIGFAHSNPNPNPAVGGAEIEIAGKTYSFGSLAYEFYYSNELSDVFPY